MKFYNRIPELEVLEQTRRLAEQKARMTFVVGRRRIGKTSLLLKSASDTKFLYFFVSKKSEQLLCEEFVAEIRRKLDAPVFGEIKTFKEVFAFVMHLSAQQHFTLIIDEFQEWNTINAAVFSEMQQLWDLRKEQSRLNLILCGSVYSMMTAIFEDAKEPLFGRATGRIHLQPLGTGTLKEILRDHYPAYTPDDLLAFYAVTGGVPKYIELLADARAFTLEDMADTILAGHSLFREEGKNVLIEDFGKDYGTYFSILSLIASGKTSRPGVESVLQRDIGGFLEVMEKKLHIIQKVQPVTAKPGGRTIRYKIKDNFLHFWFRFIYKNQNSLAAGNSGYVKEIILRDYESYSGMLLEKYFREKLTEEGRYTKIGRYWEKRNANEIDIVALDDALKEVHFMEVKRNAQRIDLRQLQEKSKKVRRKYTSYKARYLALSLEDM